MRVVDVDPTADGSLAKALDPAAGTEGWTVRIRPGPNGDGYPLVDWVLTPLPETCDRENLALAIDYQGARIPWDDLVRFSRAYPSLPMVLSGASIGNDGVIPAALEVAPNLILEVAPLSARTEALDRLVARFGSHRFTERADAIDAGAWREAHL
jgi:hypothetical protein